MEPWGSMPHSQGLCNNPYREANEPNSSHWQPFLSFILTLSSHLRLGFPKSLFPVGSTVEVLKALLPSSLLATWSAHLNLLYLITLTYLGKSSTKYQYHAAASSNPKWWLDLATGSVTNSPLSRVSRQSRLPANDKGGNEMILRVVHRFPVINLIAEENPGKSQLGDRRWTLCDQSSP